MYANIFRRMTAQKIQWNIAVGTMGQCWSKAESYQFLIARSNHNFRNS